ncbi:6298_t:CDS:2, partial [Racocetra persica]
METMEIVKSLIKKNDFMTSIDIQDVFYHIPLSSSSQNIYQNDKTSSRIGKKPQNQTFYLSGQHSFVSLFKVRNNRIYSNYTSNISETRLQDQYGQVQPSLISTVGRNSSIKIKNSMANKRQKPSLDKTRLEYPSEIVTAEYSTTGLVDHELGELQQKMFNFTPTNDNHMHRCITYQMGLPKSPRGLCVPRIELSCREHLEPLPIQKDHDSCTTLARQIESTSRPSFE